MEAMLNKKIAWLIAMLLVGGSLSSYSALASEKKAETETDSSVVVIVNSENEIHDISSVELKRIYLGKINYWDNREIILKATLKTGSSLQEFWLSSVLEVTTREYQQIWIKNIFTGKADPPESFATVKKVIEFVSENPEAIGFVLEADSLPVSVKTITVDGSNQLKREDN